MKVRRRRKSSRRRIIYLTLILVGVALVAVGYYASSTGRGSQISYTSVKPDEEHIRGDVNAPVTIVEYSDYQCQWCARVEATLDRILEDYDGKVRLIYRHFPITSIHKYAWKAAEASECAADQGRFWEYSRTLFENQKALSINDLKKYAEELGLDMNLFNACLDSDFMSDRVQADIDEGKRVDVRATPTFVIDGKIVSGALPYEDFRKVIDEALVRKGE